MTIILGMFVASVAMRHALSVVVLLTVVGLLDAQLDASAPYKGSGMRIKATILVSRHGIRTPFFDAGAYNISQFSKDERE